MGSGGKGGSQKTEVKVPKWLEDAARDNIARANYISQMGPVSGLMGPTVAAFSDATNAAHRMVGDMAAAYGMLPEGTDLTYQRAPTTFAGGIRGYSAQPLYEETMDAFRRRYPGQYDFISGMFIDPVTGRPSTGGIFGGGAPSAAAAAAPGNYIYSADGMSRRPMPEEPRYGWSDYGGVEYANNGPGSAGWQIARGKSPGEDGRDR